MRVVYTADHLLHDPPSEVTGGQSIPAYEVPGRAESIRTALEADGGFAFEELGRVDAAFAFLVSMHNLVTAAICSAG